MVIGMILTDTDASCSHSAIAELLVLVLSCVIAERKHCWRLDIRRGNNWLFSLSPLFASNLAQFDLVSVRLHAIREARLSKLHVKIRL